MFPMGVFRKAKIACQFGSSVFTTNYQSL